MRRVAESTNCFDMVRVKDALASCGNVDDAIELVIESMETKCLDSEGSKNGTPEPDKGSDDRADSLGQNVQAVEAGPVATHVCVAFRITKKKKRVKVTFELEAQDANSACQTSHDGAEQIRSGATGTDGSPAPYKQGAASGGAQKEKLTKMPVTKAEARAAKNKMCSCGSGRKYKNCCAKAGKAAAAQSSSCAQDVIAAVTPNRLITIDI